MNVFDTRKMYIFSHSKIDQVLFLTVKLLEIFALIIFLFLKYQNTL